MPYFHICKDGHIASGFGKCPSCPPEHNYVLTFDESTMPRPPMPVPQGPTEEDFYWGVVELALKALGDAARAPEVAQWGMDAALKLKNMRMP